MICILLLVCVVDGGCHRAFVRLDYIEGDKIIVLQYSLLVLLVSLVLSKKIWKSSGVIRFIPFGSVKCFISYILCRSSLWRSLRVWVG